MKRVAIVLALVACRQQQPRAPVTVTLTIDVMAPATFADLAQRLEHSDVFGRLEINNARLTARGPHAAAITFDAVGRTRALAVCRALGHAVLADDVRGPLEVRFRDDCRVLL